MTRRIITAINKDGNSVFLEDKHISPINPYPVFPRFSLTDLFYTEQNPQGLDLQETQQPFQLEMPSGAFRFCICHIPPMSELLADFIEYSNQAGNPLPENEEDFMLHKTHSIDHVYLLASKHSAEGFPCTDFGRIYKGHGYLIAKREDLTMLNRYSIILPAIADCSSVVVTVNSSSFFLLTMPSICVDVLGSWRTLE